MMIRTRATTRPSFKDFKRELVEDFERRYLVELLERHDYQLSDVLRFSGLSRRRLCNLLRKHGLDGAQRVAC